MLMLILIKRGVEEGEEEEIFVTTPNCFEEHGLKHSNFTLIFLFLKILAVI